jgi:iron complex outermembrane receptor protein
MVGGRVDIYRRSSHNNPIEDGLEIEGPVLHREANAVTGRVGVVYQAVPSLDLYGSLANSFRPLTQAQPDGTTLDPERGRQLELGQRFHLVNDRVQLSTAFFHIVRSNVAFSRPGGFYNQASEVESNGFEAEVTTSVASNWRVTGGYGFTSATFGDYFVNATTNLNGNTSIMAPRHIFNLWTAYDWANGFGVNVGVRAQSEMFIDSGNEFTIGGYGLLNLGPRYRRGPLQFALAINHLSDTEYFASVLYDSQMYPGEPINVLGTFRVRLR